MPQSTLYRNIQQGYPDGGDPDRLSVATFSPQSVGDTCIAHGAPAASGTWPTTNLALFFPFVVTGLQEARTYSAAIWMNGAAVSGNIDVGIYDALGNRLVSLGLTAQIGTTAPQKGSFTTPTQLRAGRYFLGVAMDNTTGALVRSNPPALAARVAGVRQLGTAIPLPASVSGWVGSAQAYVPWVALVEGSWV